MSDNSSASEGDRERSRRRMPIWRPKPSSLPSLAINNDDFQYLPVHSRAKSDDTSAHSRIATEMSKGSSETSIDTPLENDCPQCSSMDSDTLRKERSDTREGSGRVWKLLRRTPGTPSVVPDSSPVLTATPQNAVSNTSADSNPILSSAPSSMGATGDFGIPPQLVAQSSHGSRGSNRRPSAYRGKNPRPVSNEDLDVSSSQQNLPRRGSRTSSRMSNRSPDACSTPTAELRDDLQLNPPQPSPRSNTMVPYNQYVHQIPYGYYRQAQNFGSNLATAVVPYGIQGSIVQSNPAYMLQRPYAVIPSMYPMVSISGMSYGAVGVQYPYYAYNTGMGGRGTGVDSWHRRIIQHVEYYFRDENLELYILPFADGEGWVALSYIVELPWVMILLIHSSYFYSLSLGWNPGTARANSLCWTRFGKSNMLEVFQGRSIRRRRPNRINDSGENGRNESGMATTDNIEISNTADDGEISNIVDGREISDTVDDKETSNTADDKETSNTADDAREISSTSEEQNTPDHIYVGTVRLPFLTASSENGTQSSGSHVSRGLYHTQESTSPENRNVVLVNTRQQPGPITSSQNATQPNQNRLRNLLPLIRNIPCVSELSQRRSSASPAGKDWKGKGKK